MNSSCKIFESHGQDFASIDVNQKRASDQRSLRTITLPNNLSVLLISDPTLNKSSAALSVNVGSLSDPEEHLGLAHFLEHVLFLGTKKYPEVDEYNQFLQSYQGHSNAYTAAEQTNYYFEVNHDGFSGALDRFAQFFVDPLFSADYIDRERHAVDSEHQKNLKDDTWRIQNLLRHLHRDGHPRQKFSTGDIETLKNADRNQLMAFYKRYYSADVMKLAIMSHENLDTAEALVRETFAAVPNRNRGPIEFDSKLFSDEALPRLVLMKPIKDMNRLLLVFPVPSADQYWQSKPDHLLSHLIGYEGKGSLLSALKKEQLVTGLSSWVSSESYGGLFSVDMTLTEAGVKSYERVIELFFAFTKRLKDDGLHRYLYDERRVMAEIDYVYREPKEGGHVSSHYAASMQLFAGDEIDKNEQLFHQYDPKIFAQYVEALTPERMTTLFMHPKIDKTSLDQLEQHYQAPFGVKSFTEKTIALFKNASDSRLTLPEANKFIPKKLKLAPTSAPTKPDRIVNNEWGSFWFQQDDRFHLPKTIIRINLLSDLINRSPKDKTLGLLYLMALHESHNEWNYDISLAGLHYGVGRTDRGIVLEFSGYSENIPMLINSVVDKLRKITIDEATFDTIKTDFKKSIANSAFDAAYSQAFYELRYILSKSFLHRDHIFNPDHKVDLITDITLADIHQFAKDVYHQFALEGVGYGSIDEKIVVEAINNFPKKLTAQALPVDKRPIDRTLKFSSSQQLASTIDTKTNNNSYILHIQFGERSFELNAILRLGMAHIKGGFYTELRTKQQLGYIVAAQIHPTEKSLSVNFIIQSSDYTPADIAERVLAYLPLAVKELSELTEDEFQTYRDSVIDELREKDKTMAERHQVLFAEIYDYKETFDYREKIAQAAEKIQKETLVETFKQAFDEKTKASLAIYLSKNGDPLSKTKESKIKDVERLKSTTASF